MKYELRQTIFYFLNNKVHSAPILSRICVENANAEWIANNTQEELFAQFGKARTVYATCHGEIAEEDAFASKEELIASLV